MDGPPSCRSPTWRRRAHVEGLKASSVRTRFRLGLVLMFHITPANVPLMFAFSCTASRGQREHRECPDQALSAGGRCVRRRRRVRGQTLRGDREQDALVNYEHDEEITQAFPPAATPVSSGGATGPLTGSGRSRFRREASTSVRGHSVALRDRRRRGAAGVPDRAAAARQRLLQRHIPVRPERLFLAAADRLAGQCRGLREREAAILGQGECVGDGQRTTSSRYGRSRNTWRSARARSDLPG